MTKLSVNKTKWTSLLSRTRALILLDFDLNILTSTTGICIKEPIRHFHVTLSLYFKERLSEKLLI